PPRAACLRSCLRSGRPRAGGAFSSSGATAATAASVLAFFLPRPPRFPRRRLFFAVPVASGGSGSACGASVGSGTSVAAASSTADSSCFLPKRNQRRGKVFLSFDRAREKRRCRRLLQRAAGVENYGHGPRLRLAGAPRD